MKTTHDEYSTGYDGKSDGESGYDNDDHERDPEDGAMTIDS